MIPKVATINQISLPKTGLWTRLLAKVIDISIFAPVWWLLVSRTPLFHHDPLWPLRVHKLDARSIMLEVLLMVPCPLFLALYEFLSLRVCGNTLGKKAAAIRVVRFDGSRPSPTAMAKRSISSFPVNIILFIPIVIIIALPVFYFAYKNNRETFWDRRSFTRVVDDGWTRTRFFMCVALSLAIKVSSVFAYLKIYQTEILNAALAGAVKDVNNHLSGAMGQLFRLDKMEAQGGVLSVHYRISHYGHYLSAPRSVERLTFIVRQGVLQQFCGGNFRFLSSSVSRITLVARVQGIKEPVIKTITRYDCRK